MSYNCGVIGFVVITPKMRLIRIGGSKVCHLWRKPLDRNIAAGHWKQYHSENGVFGHNPHGENLIQRQPGKYLHTSYTLFITIF